MTKEAATPGFKCKSFSQLPRVPFLSSADFELGFEDLDGAHDFPFATLAVLNARCLHKILQLAVLSSGNRAPAGEMDSLPAPLGKSEIRVFVSDGERRRCRFL